jgi:ParB family chromosome partitioning protein
MNEAPVLIDIALIVSNPFQVRQAEDPAAVAELAANIEKNTLLQPPTVRLDLVRMAEPPTKPSDEGWRFFQLAFGHTRLAAFKLLAGQGKPEFKQIPCFIKELNDLQMFEMAVSENIQRRDLNPVERAKAMRTYMETFKKSSAETGEFFNCDEATVRGTVRLLGLPELAQEKLASRQITVGTARKLLTIQKTNDGNVLARTIDRIAQGEDPDDVVSQALSSDAFCMWENWRHEDKPLAGEGLWPLTEPLTKAWRSNFPKLEVTPVLKALDGNVEGTPARYKGPELQAVINTLNEDPEVRPHTVLPGDVVDRLVHLASPLPCTACDLYIRNQKNHYCIWKPCWERKRKGWGKAELEKLSKKLKIPIWDPAVDPKDSVSVDALWLEDSDYMVNWKRPAKADYYRKIFDGEQREKNLRLRVKFSTGTYGGRAHHLTDSPIVEAVDADPKMIAWLKKQKEAHKAAKDEKEKNGAATQIDFIQKETNSQAFSDFIDQVAGPMFASALNGLESLPLLQEFSGLDDNDLGDVDEKEKKRCCRSEIMGHQIHENFDWEDRQTGPAGCAGRMIELAQAWDVKLPEDFQARAEAFGKDPVPTETKDE